MVFTNIKKIELPKTAEIGKGFTIIIEANGEIPFAQVIIRHTDGWEWIVKEQYVTHQGKGYYHFQVPSEAYHVGTAYLQIEGCRVADIGSANPNDWITVHHKLQIIDTAISQSVPRQPIPTPAITLGESNQPVIYFGIHKHNHQPYYNSTDTEAWDGEKDEIFGNRSGPYTHFIPAAVWQYINGGLNHAGLSTSWSGSLIEQLNRCGAPSST
jgi:hypothetical protein